MFSPLKNTRGMKGTDVSPVEGNVISPMFFVFFVPFVVIESHD